MGARGLGVTHDETGAAHVMPQKSQAHVTSAVHVTCLFISCDVHDIKKKLVCFRLSLHLAAT